MRRAGGLVRAARRRARAEYWGAVRRIGRRMFGVADVDTEGLVPLDELGLGRPGRVQYQPSTPTWLWRGLRGLRVGPDDVLLDYGCGKGQVVVQAARRYGFRKVIGVDIAPELVQIAQRNLERARPGLRAGEVELVVADAETWPLPDEVTHVYMYRPFTGEVFANAMQRVVESLDRRPRRLTLIYAYPEEEAAVLATGRFRRIRVSKALNRRPHHAVHVYVSEP